MHINYSSVSLARKESDDFIVIIIISDSLRLSLSLRVRIRLRTCLVRSWHSPNGQRLRFRDVDAFGPRYESGLALRV